MYLDTVRRKRITHNVYKQILITIGFVVLGFALGWFSKYLDHRQGTLPYLLQAIDNFLDLHNFLSTFAPWVLICTCISVYSSTPIRAAVNVFSFLSSFLLGYYLYTFFIAGFFPKNYVMLWLGFTILSPLFAYIAWYATGRGILSIVISAFILSLLINCAFGFGLYYISIVSFMNLLLFIICAVVLRRPSKEMTLMLGISFLIAILYVFVKVHIF